jgi:hypothetical protein
LLDLLGFYSEGRGLNLEIAGSAVSKSDSLQHEDNASLSQLYTTGHLAEEVASSVIRSVSKEVEQIHKDSQEDENEEWIHISQDPSSIVHAPQLSGQAPREPSAQVAQGPCDQAKHKPVLCHQCYHFLPFQRVRQHVCHPYSGNYY